MNDFEKLDQARQAFLNAKTEIARLRDKIAKDICPLRIGQRVTVVTDGKEFEGVINSISASCHIRELLDPVVGSPAGWSVSGPKIKRDGGESKHGFSFGSLNTELVSGKWIVTEQNIDDFLSNY